MQLRFRSSQELRPGEKTHRRFDRLWPALREWFCREGEGRRPGFMSCRKALERHMPRLAPTWEKLSELVGGGDHEARMLSLYRPTPYMSGCSQAVWTRERRPLLVRNYDYHPHHCEGTILLSAWNGVKTIVQSDCLWGVLDGMNEHGLVVSLAFGGRRAVGEGFGIPLVLRYILEFSTNVDEAREVLASVPSHMAYNVLAIEPSGRFVNAHLSPDRKTLFANSPAATNHQREIEWTRHAEATCSLERERFIHDRLDSPVEQRARFADRFLEQPLYNTRWEAGFGTLYTSVYDPVERTVEYRWPHHTWRLSFDSFAESELLLHFGRSGGKGSPSS